MGLMDVLNGMANGPRGPAQPGQRGGISPITMGLLALLAYKTMHGQGPLGGLFRQGAAPAGNAPAGNAPSAPPQGGAGGGLLDWLQNGLGGTLAGGAAGQSWVGHGPNQPVTPDSLERAAGADTLDALARETGMPRDELLQRLSAELPHDVDRLTPQGRIPTADEASV